MKWMFAAILSLFMLGCAEEMVYADPPLPPPQPTYGCAVVEDAYGEREVCDVYYYTSDDGVVYWDPYFSLWIGAGGYWRAGVWYHGYWPGYWERYHVWYHAHGWFGAHGYRGYYGHHWGHSGGGYHGGYHGGGGHYYHGGGGHHGGHR